MKALKNNKNDIVNAIMVRIIPESSLDKLLTIILWERQSKGKYTVYVLFLDINMINK